MKNSELKQTLLETCNVQSYSEKTKLMQEFILDKLSKMNNVTFFQDKLGNIFATKEDKKDKKKILFPTMACHIDTVHRIIPNKHYKVLEIEREKDTILFALNTSDMSNTGIGGDDKVGIAITLHLLNSDSFPNFKAAFFVDEEIGCVGSRQADMSFFEDSTCVLQCDRKGYGDFVKEISWTELYSKKFSKKIKETLFEFGLKEVSGGMTDVQMIAEQTDVCVANMGCGYYNPHQDNEYISVNDVERIAELCSKILTITSGTKWRMSDRKINYSYADKYLKSSDSHAFPSYYPKGDAEIYEDENYVYCEESFDYIPKSEAVEIYNDVWVHQSFAKYYIQEEEEENGFEL